MNSQKPPAKNKKKLSTEIVFFCIGLLNQGYTYPQVLSKLADIDIHVTENALWKRVKREHQKQPNLANQKLHGISIPENLSPVEVVKWLKMKVSVLTEMDWISKKHSNFRADADLLMKIIKTEKELTQNDGKTDEYTQLMEKLTSTDKQVNKSLEKLN